MPRLARIRFVSLGHADARMPDLLLDFCDRGGRATDSTLWLRNGGGKSSILNLFFALVRPDRREFLGGKAEGKQRHLEHYVLSNDRGVMAAEWDLDGTDRYVTGVFYEWQDGALRRYFFAARSSNELSIETLPLTIDGPEGRKTRRTLAGFRSEWQALRQRLPQQQLVSTENQTEWKGILAGAGIDHELFAYQVKMNEREGGADTLFRFKDPEDFVDFLLQLVLDPSYGDKVGDNLKTFREELLERKSRHLPERDLCLGLAERLKSLAEVAGARRELDARRLSLTGRKNGLKRYLAIQFSRMEEEIVSLKRQAEEDRRAVDEANGAAATLRASAAALRRHARRAAVQEAMKRLATTHERHENAIRHAALLDAARPLFQALRHERTVKELQDEMERRRAEHRPLREELGQAAAEYGAALLHQKDQFERKASLTASREKEARASAAAAQGQASDCNHELGKLKAELATLEKELEQAHHSRVRLETDGVLHPGESAIQAQSRLEKLVADQEGAAIRADSEGRRISGEIETCGAEMRAAASEESACRAKESEGRRTLAADLNEKARLEGRPALKSHLEVESVDIDRLDEAVLERLDHSRRRLAERIAALRTETAEDQRAVASLENGGLLPASPDVERLLDTLKGVVRGAWSGWSALEANLPKEHRRSFIEKRPDLAGGIVVRDDQLETAVKHIRASGVLPEQPVLLSPQGAIQSPHSPREGVVVGPASDAFFDKAVGAQELARRQSRLDERRSEFAKRNAELDDLSSALVQIRHFRETHPAGWARKESLRLDDLLKRADALASAQDSLKTRESALRSALAAEETRSRSARQSIHAAQLHRMKVDDFHARHEAVAGEREQRRHQTISRADDMETRKKELVESAQAHLRAADEAALEKQTAGQNATRVAMDLSRIAYLPEGLLPGPGVVDILGDRYELLKSEYDGKLGEEGLQQRCAENQKIAGEHRKRFVKSGQKEADVRQAMAGIHDSDQLDDVYEEAQNSKMTLMGQLGNQKKDAEVLTEKLEDIEKACADLGGVPEPTDIPDDADQEAERCDREASARTASAAQSGKRAQESMEEARNRERDATILSGHRQQLSGLEESNADLFVVTPTPEEIPPGANAPTDELLLGLSGDLRKAREARQYLDQRRGEGIRGMRKWVDEPRFKVLDATLARRLLLIDELLLEAQSATYADQLELRVKTIDDQLARINTHRELVVGELQGATDEAIGLLRAASNHSRLPQTVPGLAGKQFLRINLNVPNDPTQTRAKLADLMDEIVEQKVVPTGLELVQRAVRRVARPITVRILHPDPDYPKETVEITEMALFSGGEQLTGAILLYCTLAQLRLKRRGSLDRPSSVLILDNPIGKSSRVRFLELQRDVARSMGVQLIYTTAVNDLDALGTLPNVIRLRNERQDRNTGHRVVEHESGLVGVRIVRPETSPDHAAST